MITAIVQFDLPGDISSEQAKAMFQESAPRYRDMPGLVRKYYLFGNGKGGGVYLWESREAAEAVYGGVWLENLRKLSGADPMITYFESPVIVDNTVGEIQVAA